MREAFRLVKPDTPILQLISVNEEDSDPEAFEVSKGPEALLREIFALLVRPRLKLSAAS